MEDFALPYENFRSLNPCLKLPFFSIIRGSCFSMGRRKSRKANEASTKSDSAPLQLSNCYEGERLSALLRRLERAIESARLLKGALPEKIWIKLGVHIQLVTVNAKALVIICIFTLLRHAPMQTFTEPGPGNLCISINIIIIIALSRILMCFQPYQIDMQQFAIGVNDVTRVLERMPSTEVGVSAQESPVTYKHSKAPSVQLQAVLLASDCNPKWLTKHLPGLASSRRVPLIFVGDMKSGSLRLGEVVKLKTAIAIGVKAKGGGINKAIEEVLSDREPTKGAESDES